MEAGYPRPQLRVPGFGGARVALVESGARATVATDLLPLYRNEGHQESVLVQS
jgi:hypothetical protein